MPRQITGILQWHFLKMRMCIFKLWCEHDLPWKKEEKKRFVFVLHMVLIKRLMHIVCRSRTFPHFDFFFLSQCRLILGHFLACGMSSLGRKKKSSSWFLRISKTQQCLLVLNYFSILITKLKFSFCLRFDLAKERKSGIFSNQRLFLFVLSMPISTMQ